MKEQINIGSGPDVFNIQASTIVRMSEYFTLITAEGDIDIKADINVDLASIPEKYHEVVLNMLTSKYTNKVSFGDNPFSLCVPSAKKKWYQIWK